MQGESKNDRPALTQPVGRFSDQSEEFHRQEYVALRAEVLSLLSDLRSLERNVVVAIGITFAWLIKEDKDVPCWAWVVPIVFAGLGAWRVRGILRQFGLFKRYLLTIEAAYHSEGGPMGWQGFSASPDEPSASDGTGLFWGTLIVGTILVAVYQICFQRALCRFP